MPADGTLRVPARVDPWLVVVVALGLALGSAVVAPLVWDPGVALAVKTAVGALWLGAVGLTLGLALPVAYRLEAHGLTVRAGVLTLRFAYRDLVRVDRVISPLSGPAWSLVRVRVALDGGGWIEIAPRDRDAFLAELAARAPHLRPTARGLADPERAPTPAPPAARDAKRRAR